MRNRLAVVGVHDDQRPAALERDDAIEVEDERSEVVLDLGADRDAFRRAPARRDLRRRDVPQRGNERVGDEDIAILRHHEVVEHASAKALERSHSLLARDVVDGDRAREAAGHVQLPPGHLHADRFFAGGPRNELLHQPSVERPPIDGAASTRTVAGGADEEGAAALVEGDPFGIAVGRRREGVDPRLASAVVPVVSHDRASVPPAQRRRGSTRACVMLFRVLLIGVISRSSGKGLARVGSRGTVVARMPGLLVDSLTE